MTKGRLSIARRMVNSIRKAVGMLEDRPAPAAKAKLDGRRGYGDGGIPTPGQTPDEK